MTRPALFTRWCVASALALTLGPISSAQVTDAWRPFNGSWSAAGRRHAMAVDNERTAAIVELSGAIVVAAGDGMARGFRGEVISFDDGEGLSTGRAIWTDARGDRVFSRLKGEPIAGGRRIAGTITGGTGRYTGLEGEYAFTWKYVVVAEDDRIQGRSADLSGRVRRVMP